MTYDVRNPSVARLFSGQPDWRSGYEVTRSFKTDMTRSRNGTEQRRALRKVPRLSVRYRTVDEVSHFMRVWQANPTAIPDFSRHALVSGSGDTLTFTTVPAWVSVGGLLVLCGDTPELVEVESIAGTTVTLTDTLAGTWGAGSVVRPGLFGLLSGTTQSSRFHRGIAETSVDFAVYPGGEPPEDEGTGTTFNGYEVLTAEPDWSASPSFDYIWPVEQIDFGTGRTAEFRPIVLPQNLIEAEFPCSVAEAVAIEQFFLRRKGRRGAFYRSTGHKDFTLAANASGTSFAAQGTALFNDLGTFDFATYPQAIEAVLTDGTRLRRLVTGITTSGGNSIVAVNSSITMTTANTARISWLPLVRFASDDLVTRWITPLRASIRTAFQGIVA